MRRFLYLFLMVVTLCRLSAQIPPCGIEVVRAGGTKLDERFIAAPPEQVKMDLLKALPAIASTVHKDEGFHIESRTDADLQQSVMRTNHDMGVRGLTAGMPSGDLFIDIQDATQAGVKGTLLHIKYEVPRGFGNDRKVYTALPLGEETACLVKVLSVNDPAKNPRGLAIENGGTPHSIALPEGTPIKVLLRDALWSKSLAKNSTGQTIQFEVAEDVVLDGSTLVRRGALATGHFTEMAKAKGYGRNAEVQFVFDTATAVDGQAIPITDEGEKVKGGRSNQIVSTALMYPTLGWLAKGSEVLIRAGMTYEVETVGQHTVQAGH